jgi:hypothetical protein
MFGKTHTDDDEEDDDDDDEEELEKVVEEATSSDVSVVCTHPVLVTRCWGNRTCRRKPQHTTTAMKVEQDRKGCYSGCDNDAEGQENKAGFKI